MSVVGFGVTEVGTGADVVGDGGITPVVGCGAGTSGLGAVTGGEIGPGPVDPGGLTLGLPVPPVGSGEVGPGEGATVVDEGSAGAPSSEEQALAITMATTVAVYLILIV